MLFFRSPRPTPGVVGVVVTGVAVLLSVLHPVPARAHSGSHASVHDTVAGILERVKRSPGGRERAAFTRNRVVSILTDAERHVLATGHLTFRVDQPVLVTVFHDQALGRDPFWLRDGTWHRPSDAKLRVGDATFDFWQKEFPAGEIGLGVNSLAGAPGIISSRSGPWAGVR